MEEEKKKTIGVIGDDEFTLGFELAGVQKSFNPENYEEKIQELLKHEEIGILVAEQTDLEKLPGRVRREVEESVDPVVVTLSETAESSGLQDKIQRVIGVDIS
ncbi:MAG: V-type ATP synthase subunit F [Nanohaloarchaea archaeon]|nr:V-type ATP synthase subunit F [Candidatus Nanohaloarchaea archaeon]